MITLNLPEDEAQRFLSWLVQAQGAWLVTNPVIIQLASQLQPAQQQPAVNQEGQRHDGADRAHA